jgi:cytochrome c553
MPRIVLSTQKLDQSPILLRPRLDSNRLPPSFHGTRIAITFGFCHTHVIRAISPRLLFAAAALIPVTGSLATFDARAQTEAIPAFKTVDSMEARVQGCVTCHGQSGQGTQNEYFPRIAGKPAGYLYNQLIAFRDGRRRYAPMNYLVAYLPDGYLREMAEHFAKLRPPFGVHETVPAEPATLNRGQQLATAGDSNRGVPACLTCHGAGLTGMEPGIPGLVGLRPNYIAAQLTRWRVGERTAAEPDCMKRIATRLTDSDIHAVAAWLARQRPPGDPSPESSNLVRMPLACGSQR